MKSIKKLLVICSVVLLINLFTSTVFAAESFKWNPVTVSADGKVINTAITYIPDDTKTVKQVTVSLVGKNVTTGDSYRIDTMTKVMNGSTPVDKGFLNITMGSSTPYAVFRNIVNMFPKNTNSLVHFEIAGISGWQSDALKITVDSKGAYTITDNKTKNILYPAKKEVPPGETPGEVPKETPGETPGKTPGKDTGNSANIIKLKNPLKSDLNSIPKIINAILDHIVIPIAVPIFILAIIYTGVMFVIARGKPEGITEAKKSLKWTIIGGAVILGAKLISTAIAGTLAAITNTVVK